MYLVLPQTTGRAEGKGLYKPKSRGSFNPRPRLVFEYARTIEEANSLKTTLEATYSIPFEIVLRSEDKWSIT
jgi:hypothetical protein